MICSLHFSLPYIYTSYSLCWYTFEFAIACDMKRQLTRTARARLSQRSRSQPFYLVAMYWLCLYIPNIVQCMYEHIYAVPRVCLWYLWITNKLRWKPYTTQQAATSSHTLSLSLWPKCLKQSGTRTSNMLWATHSDLWREYKVTLCKVRTSYIYMFDWAVGVMATLGDRSDIRA